MAQHIATIQNPTAADLAQFITGTLATLPAAERINYIEADGGIVSAATFVRRTLTDGSTVVELVLALGD